MSPGAHPLAWLGTAIGALLLASAAWGQPGAAAQAAPLTVEQLEAECSGRPDMRAFADCACYARRVQALRVERPSSQDDVRRLEAFEACPDPKAIAQTQQARCLDQRTLMVPAGVDAGDYCRCYGDTYAAAAQAHAPARHTADTVGLFMTRASNTCRSRVQPAPRDDRHLPDLSGPWRMRIDRADLQLDGVRGRWTEAPQPDGGFARQTRLTATVVGFPNMASATVMILQPLRSSEVMLVFESNGIPYLPAHRCRPTEATAERVLGRCQASNGADIGAFTLSRAMAPAVGAAAPAPAAPATPATAAPGSPTPTPGAAAPAPQPQPQAPVQACPEGGKACTRNCLALLAKPSADIAQRVLQCRNACKANCGS